MEVLLKRGFVFTTDRHKKIKDIRENWPFNSCEWKYIYAGHEEHCKRVLNASKVSGNWNFDIGEMTEVSLNDFLKLDL